MKNLAKPTRKSQSREAMLLTELVDRYIDSINADRPLGHELSPRTKSHHLEVVQVFKRYLGHDATVGDLTSEVLNVFLESELKAGRSPYTVKNRRTGLMVLWRFAKRERLTRLAAKGVRTVRCQALDSRGYSEQEMESLVAAASKERGVIRGTGIRQTTYWVSALLIMWDLGLRAGDVVKIEVANLDSTGRLFVLEHKTRKNGWHPLRPTTLAAVKACIEENPSRKLIWPGYKDGNFCLAFKALAVRAKLPGTTRWVRRGSGSAVERDRPGSGWRFLNHSSPSVFENHYRDARICDVGTVAPPEIEFTGLLRPVCASHGTSGNAERTIDVLPAGGRDAIAAEICREWQSTEWLTGDLIRAALDRLSISQTQLARGVGLTMDWINVLVCGRESIGKDTDMRIRVFVQQLADGRVPTPLIKDLSSAMYATPLDVELNDEIKAALLHVPLTAADVKLLAEFLRTHGISHRKFAEWWGVKFKFWQNMRYGYKKVPHTAADRLRQAFGLPTICLPGLPPTKDGRPKTALIAAGSIPATAAIVEVLNARRFGPSELNRVIKYICDEIQTPQWVIAISLGIGPGTLSQMKMGRIAITVRSSIRKLFMLNAKIA